jgi:hypothetical protein
LLFFKRDTPYKKTPAPTPEKKKNYAIPRGEPQPKMPYKNSIACSFTGIKIPTNPAL